LLALNLLPSTVKARVLLLLLLLAALLLLLQQPQRLLTQFCTSESVGWRCFYVEGLCEPNLKTCAMPR
jgi:hypothetical protein